MNSTPQGTHTSVKVCAFVWYFIGVSALTFWLILLTSGVCWKYDGQEHCLKLGVQP